MYADVDNRPDDWPEQDPMDAYQTPSGGHTHRITIDFTPDSALHAQLFGGLILIATRKNIGDADVTLDELDYTPGAEVLLPQFGCATGVVVP